MSRELLKQAFYALENYYVDGEIYKPFLDKTMGDIQAEHAKPEQPVRGALASLRRLYTELTNADHIVEDGAIVGYTITSKQLDNFDNLLLWLTHAQSEAQEGK